MRSRFLLFPPALIASAAPAQAYQYLTLPQAQAKLFPGAKFIPHDITMDISQVAALIKAAQGSVPGYKIKASKVSTGGWVFLDKVPGRDDLIVYVVGVDTEGKIKGVEILECLPRYDASRSPKWLTQFLGKKHSETSDLASSIEIISGTSLSSEHVAAGVRRIMAAYSLFFAPQTD